MKKQWLSFCALFLLALSFHSVQALEPTLKAQIESKLAAGFGPQVKVRSVEKLAKNQLLEVVLIDGSKLYMTPDSNFFTYRDELYELTLHGVVNVSEQRLAPVRKKSMQAIKDAETVVFKAKGVEKAKVSVYTDIECPYCQKLHDEVPRLNEMGVTVRYLAYPRSGITDPETGLPTSSYRKINYVWCAKDKAQAMTEMKATQQMLGNLMMQVRQGGGSIVEGQYKAAEGKMRALLSGDVACKSPVVSQFQQVHALGVSGTPAIITADGDIIPGYMPADDLVKRLGL